MLLLVEDEADMRMLVRIYLRADDRLEVSGEAEDIATALEMARASAPDLIILDHRLPGDVMGLDAAPQFKAIAPHARIILFSASEEMRLPALAEPSVDAFLLKTDVTRLLPLARELLGLDPRD